ncbi:MAG: hypothetical protein FJ276_11130 [Planctomycetes bacterium]|nr:hypothetical protein [Planctomycetota bacterium]
MKEKSNTSSNGRRRSLSTKKKLLFFSIVCLFCLFLLYAGTLLARTHGLYGHLKDNRRGWSAPVHEQDSVLGFRPIPGVETSEVFPVGPPVPTRIDDRGFRVAADAAKEPRGNGPLVMAFGCSFTFGAACRAEDGFPYLVAQRLEGRCINAGVCSYGLTQMLLRARQLIPKYQPDIVLVQYSPWLVDRALSCYSPTYFGRQPVPYFADRGDELAIQPAPFAASSIDAQRYDATPRSLGDYASFTARAGIPLMLHDDLWGLTTWLRQRVRAIPPPSGQRQKVVTFVYREFSDLCRAAGATMVVVILDKGVASGERESLAAATDALVVDAHAALVSRLPVSGPAVHQAMAYQHRYGHWHGNPPVMVDDHPNEQAHQIIAAEIVGVVRGPSACHGVRSAASHCSSRAMPSASSAHRSCAGRTPQA